MKTISCAERDSLRQGGTKRSSEYNRDLKTEEMNNRQLTVNCHVTFNTSVDTARRLEQSCSLTSHVLR